MGELKACPFCLGNSVEVDFEGKPEQRKWGVVCACGANIENIYNSMEEAVKAWNTRADGWIKADGNPPQDDSAVFVCKDGHRFCAKLLSGVNGYWWADPSSGDFITNFEGTSAWQPLPEAPDE